MDYFRIVLGLTFFQSALAFPMPTLNSLVILDERKIQVIP